MFGQDDDQQAPQNDGDTGHVSDGIALDGAAASDAPQPSNNSPVVGPVSGAPDMPGSEAPSRTPFTAGSSDLVDIKQKALQQLSPLVSHLDQTAEEKFRTTMMMIQASDDQSLIKSAYEAAQNITDEKARAQALLDVINEINYFTQKHDSGDQAES